MKQYLIDGQVRDQTFIATIFPDLSWDWRVDLPQHLIEHLALVEIRRTQKPTNDTGCRVEHDGFLVLDGVAVEQWKQTPLTPEEIQADTQRRNKELMESIVRSTQDRLDDFARTRNYDGILSACTYATSAVPKFHSEGAQCVAARDATWAALYAYMAQVQAGTKPMPAGFSDVEAELPILAWSAE